MNLKIITKNLAADSNIDSPRKIDFRANWTHESNPTAWELILTLLLFLEEIEILSLIVESLKESWFEFRGG